MARRIRGPFLVVALVAAIAFAILRLTVPATLILALLGRARLPDLSPGEAGGALTGFFLVCVLLVGVSSVAVARNLHKRGGARAQPWLFALVATGLTLILLGVIHILLGALVPLDLAQRGFWNDRSAFPTAMTTVGGTLIGFAGLAWSLTAEQQARDRRERNRERGEQKRAVNRTIENVENVLSSCDRLAERGFRIAVERLTRDLAFNDPDDDASAPATARRGGARWFRALFGQDGGFPETTRELITLIGERLYDTREWRAAQQFCDYVDATAIELAADARLWLGEYLELRNEMVAGISVEVPLDLLPVVDDLEFIRDLVRIGNDLEEDDDSRDATAEYLVILAAIITALQRRASTLGGAHRRAPVDTAVLRGEVDDEEGWSSDPVTALRSALMTLDYSTVFEDDRRGWCDVLTCGDPSLSDWNLRLLLGESATEDDQRAVDGQRDIVHHFALAMLAPVRRSRLREVIADCEQALDHASDVGPQMFWDEVKKEERLKRVPFGLMARRLDLERLEWPVVTQQEGIDRFVNHRREDAEEWPRLRPVNDVLAELDDQRRATRPGFDWDEAIVQRDRSVLQDVHGPFGRD